MANINKIRLSGQTYNIQDENASKTVELTQAQYNALAVKDPNTFYIITDAQGTDLSQYYTSAQTESAITQAVSGKVDNSTYTAYTAATDSALANKLATSDFNTYSGTVDTTLSGKLDTSTFDTYSGSVETALSGKQDTLSAGTGIDITDNVISATGGGGKAIEAGRGISITTGETADTVSFNLPISAGTGTYSVIEGSNTIASGISSHAEGGSTKASGNYSHAEGYNTTASGNFSHAEGVNVTAKNVSEHASGRYNNSVSASTTFGNSGNTLFSVGNGTASNARHNAFEIRQNGDIYLTKDGQDVKLQDQLGGSSITVDTALDSGSTNPVENRVIHNKFDEVEQVTAAGLNALNDNFGGLKLMKISQTDYDNLQVKDQNTLYIIVN